MLTTKQDSDSFRDRSQHKKGVEMKVDRFTKIVLSLIAVLLFLNLISGLFVSQPVLAQQEKAAIGRYQISSWAASIGTYGHHSGYFIVDTTTGKVVDSHEEGHDITKDVQKEGIPMH
jgi:hypothetical protein